MPPDHSAEVKFEVGHVLFIDIVGYSKLLINEQSEQLQTLKQIVRGTEQFRLAKTEGKLLGLPTGDGGALVFRTSLEAPVLCALEISKALKSHPELQVRMGIHSGAVNEITDLNEQANIAGAGINIAQRVMDCGDAGHILLSKHVADDLEQYPRWRPCLHEIGDCEVKHGARLSLTNLYTDGVGNRQLPSKLARGVKQRRWKTAIIGALLAIAACVAFFVVHRIRTNGGAALSAILEKSVAVLPFENLSEDKANAYFADGIQDEILTKLASIADLKVISRTSTAKYKSKPEDLKTVSQQLGVAKIVEGTVQRAADKVRVNVQLIDARADTHLWAKSYDRDIKDVFAVESEVAQEIADSLQAKLSPREADALAAVPTQDPEAYDLFFKAEYAEREAEASLKADAYDRAAALYQQAFDRDPKFALAFARLAESRLNRHWFVAELTSGELAEVRKLAEYALTLAPNLPDAHVTLAYYYYYYGSRDYDAALQELGRALELQPNNSKVLETSAYIHRRQGQWQHSLSDLIKCEERDPRNAALAASLAGSYGNMRMWMEARRAGNRALSLDPNNYLARYCVALSYLNGEGDINATKRFIAALPPDVRLNGLATIQAAPIGVFLKIIDRNFEAALKELEIESRDPDENRARLAFRAAIHVLAKYTVIAQEEIRRTRDLLDTRLREKPNDAFAMFQLSWVELALNQKDEAMRLAERASELIPVEKDALSGPGLLAGLSEIAAQVGANARAVTILQRLLELPVGLTISIHELKIDPVWDPIRDDPGFQQLLAGKELIGPNK
jgi:TolB-like protein